MLIEQQNSDSIPVGSFHERLYEELIAGAHLQVSELEHAKRLQEETDETLSNLLIKLGLVSERDLAEILSNIYQLSLVQDSDYPEIAVTNGQIATRFMQHNHLVPLADEAEALIVCMSDPENEFAIQSLRWACAKTVCVKIGVQSEIDEAIERLYGDGRSAMGQIVENLSEDGEENEDDVEHLRDLASEAPVIRLVNLIMQRAVEASASDIHIEPFESRLKVRYRIDGVLQDVESPPSSSTAAIISRIKIMAKMNIAERRLSQDGRIILRVQGKTLDLRVSTLPTVHGESVVLRILDRQSLVLDFNSLGFSDEVQKSFLDVLQTPHGIILVTGPTGSGKTTTLYTALTRLNVPEVKIITVEDPVEYELEGINQLHVKSSIGLDFAGALRSIVRQDPDIIMIGEMRDLETARIAIQSALTGHLVLSTLHTNDAAGGITRMLDMGVEDYLITSTVNGILAQRLVRLLCSECRTPYEVLPEMAEEIGLQRISENPEVMYKAKGCEHCGQSGYQGRSIIVEWLAISESIRGLIMRHANINEIQQQAINEGMQSMYEDGLKKVIRGITTIDEILRVTQES